MKIISLLLTVLFFNDFNCKAITSMFFVDTTILATTKIHLTILTTGSVIGSQMKIIFNTEEFPYEQINPIHPCQLVQNSQVSLDCHSSYNAQKQWIIDILVTHGTITGFGTYDIYINEINNPPRALKVKSKFFFSEDDIDDSAQTTITFLGLTTPLVYVTLDNPSIGKNTNFNYRIEIKSSLTYPLDIYLIFPNYNNQDSFSSFFSQIADSNLRLEIKNIVGFNANSKIQMIDEKIIALTNSCQSGVIAGTTLSFTLTNLLCPNSYSNNDFRFELRDSFNNINQYNSYSIVAENPGELNYLSFEMSNTRINTLTHFTITFRTEEYKPINTATEILLPDEINISKIPNEDIYAEGILNIANRPPITKIMNLNHPLNSNAQGFEISNIITNSNASKDFIHSLRAYGFQTPKSTKPLEVNVTITFEDLKLMYLSTEKTYIYPTSGELNTITITLENYFINFKGTMTISLVISDPLLVNGKIEVILPQGLELDQFTPKNCQSPLQGISSISICQADTKNSFTISQMSNLEIAANTFISFTIPNVLNPGKCQKISSIKIRTITSDNYIIDENKEDHIIQFQPGSFASVQLNIKNKSNYASTIYEFTITLTNPIERNGGFMFTFPNEVSLPSSSCNESLECEIIDQSIKVNNYAKNGVIEAFSIITIAFNDIINPRSLQPTEKIDIISVSSDGYSIDRNNFNTIITNITPCIIDKVKIGISSMVTYADSTYTFTIEVLTPVVKGDNIVIIIPEDIQLSDDGSESLTLIGTGKLSIQLYNNIKANEEGPGYVLYIVINFEQVEQISKNESISFKIIGLRNPVTLRPTSSFIVSIKTKEDYLMMKSLEDLIITMTTLSKLTSIDIYPEAPEMNVLSDYIVDFETYIPLENTDSINLQYPIEILPQNKECLLEILSPDEVSIISCVHNPQDRHYIISLLVPSPTPIKIKLKFRNWMTNIPSGKLETSTFQMYMTTKEGFKKEENKAEIIITFKCPFPCEKCDDASYCTKCIPSSSFPYVFNGKCYSECPDNYSPDILTYNCIKCDEKCNKCLTSDITKCKSCRELFPYYNEEKLECLTSCPSNMYSDSKKNCQKCSESCATCVDTANKCTSCPLSSDYKYLYQTKCYIQCPNNSIEVNSYVCDDCSPSCKTCSIMPTNCTSCHSPLLLLDKECIIRDLCSSDSNLLPDYENNKCHLCQDGCRVCGNSINECVFCDNGYFQKGSTCHKIVGSCNNGYYLTPDSYCEECNRDECLLCDQSPTTCTKCNLGLFLQQSKCVTQCSSGFYLNADKTECLMCNPNCNSCTIEDQCLSCKDDLVLKIDKCITRNECLLFQGYYLSGNSCLQCTIRNCDECSEISCTVCSSGYYFYNSICAGSCPYGYIPDEASRTCLKSTIIISKAKENLKNVYHYKVSDDYFILILISLLGFIILTVLKYIYPKTFLLASYIALLSLISFVTVILLFVYSYYSGEVIQFYIIATTFVIQKMINNAFIIIYMFYTQKDEEFSYWKSTHKCSSVVFYCLMQIIDFKIIRLYYSRLCNIKVFDAKFQTYNSIHSPYKIICVVELVIVNLPLLIGCGFIIASYKTFSFLYFISIEIIIFISLLSIFIIIDLIINNDLDLDFYNQKKPKPDILPNTNDDNKPNGVSYRFDLSDIGSNNNANRKNSQMKESDYLNKTRHKRIDQSSIVFDSVIKDSSSIGDNQSSQRRVIQDSDCKITTKKGLFNIDESIDKTNNNNSNDSNVPKKKNNNILLSPKKKEISFNQTQTISFGTKIAKRSFTKNKGNIYDCDNPHKENDETNIHVHDFNQLEENNQENDSITN